MAYRNGTYIAFHADGNNRPGGRSDIDYYNLIKAWAAKTDDDFTIINSHEKASAVSDASRRQTLRNSLLERLRNSKNMVLIVGETTHLDTDWVPFEIEKAVDLYGIPIIAAYTGFDGPIRRPDELSGYWPSTLRTRINNKTARVLHIPFMKEPLKDSLRFSHDDPPPGALSIYTDGSYKNFGISG